MTTDYDKLTELNKALLALNGEVKDAFFQGIKKRQRLFEEADISEEMSNIQVQICHSQAALLDQIRQRLRHSMIQGRPKKSTSIKALILGNLRIMFVQKIPFSNNTKSNNMNSAQHPSNSQQSTTEIPIIQLPISKEQQFLQELTDIQESLKHFVINNLFERRVEYAKLNLGKPFYKALNDAKILSDSLETLRTQSISKLQ